MNRNDNIHINMYLSIKTNNIIYKYYNMKFKLLLILSIYLVNG